MRGFTHDGAGTPASAWAGLGERAPVGVLDEQTTRLVVVAAHPDDETLGAGRLLASAAATGLEVDVVVLTDGEASHPHSPTHPPDRLAAIRRDEVAGAVTALGVPRPPRLAGLPDGRLDGHHDDVVELLVRLVGDGRGVLLVAPWRADGHPDHDAAGRAAAVAAARTGARLLEYPIWFWHWGAAADVAGLDVVAHHGSDDVAARKQRAMAVHRSQVAPLSPAPGDEVLLGADLLAHFERPVELFVRTGPAATDDDALDDLHRDDPDPWLVESRWYERRKRALTLAALPRERFRRGLEIGCSRGALAADLATRCDTLLAVDASPAAVTLAEQRLAGLLDVEVRRARVPHEWPDGLFDLVVLSEVGYFLCPADLDALLGRVAGSLTDVGVVLLAHWRHPVRGWPLDGPAVHTRAAARAEVGSLPPVASRYADRDVELLVLAPDAVVPDPAG